MDIGVQEISSVPLLIRKLCEVHLGPSHKSGLSQPTRSHSHCKTKLKLNVWETLLSGLKGPHNFSEHVCDKKQLQMGELEQIYAFAFQLRSDRHFDEAQQLEDLMNKLLEDVADGELHRNMMKFLLGLTNTADNPVTKTVGYDKKIHIAVPKTMKPVLLPDCPLEYGDTQCCEIRRWYTHYPREVFEINGLEVNEPLRQNKPSLLQVFEAQPGAHLAGNGIFEAKGCLQDDYEARTQLGLYGALVQSTATSMDLTLELPDLSESTKPPEIPIPKLHESSEDEGFAESLSASNSGLVTPDDRGLSPDTAGDIWERALRYVPCNHRVWEIVGRPSQRTEQPYLSEAGPAALDCLWEVHMDQLSFVDPTLRPPDRRPVTMDALVSDIINLLLGIPSTSFVLDRTTDEFHLAPGIHLSGLTPEGTAASCSDLLDCGSLYTLLCDFSRSVLTDSFYSSGLIFQAFTGGIRKYLQHYRGCILSIPPGKTVMEIIFLLQKVMSQIRFLAQLCHCTKSTKPSARQDGEEEMFPTGVGLLSYLYEETLEATSSPHYPMMLSLLSSSCGPYLMFVQDWVFHGVCRDTYSEYMIQVNDDYLAYRDKHYWTEGYRMLPGESVPLFLSDHANDIFVCGKSINLLKLCAPQHFLFTVDQAVPRVQLTFSEDDLSAVDSTCQGYLSRMQQIARMRSLNRQQMLERAERAKQELIVQARKAAAQEISRLRDIALEKKKSEDVRKRRLFAELKDEMLKDIERRASAKKQQKGEDKLLVEARSKQEILEASVDQELERQTREELIAYYAKLSSAATLREQRALWKVRRAQLHLARQEYLQAEAEELQGEMKKLQTFSDVTEDLPKWAAQGLKEPATTFGLVDASEDEMPKWAKTSTAAPAADNNEILDLEFVYTDQNSDRNITQASSGMKREDGDIASNTALCPGEVTQTPSDSDSAGGGTDGGTDGGADGGADGSTDEGLTEKKHVSGSVVGDIMRSEPTLREKIEPTTYVGPVTLTRDAKHHPSTSTIQDLMYTEPQRQDPVKTEHESLLVASKTEHESPLVASETEHESPLMASQGDQTGDEVIDRDVFVKDSENLKAKSALEDASSQDTQGETARVIPKTKIRLVENRHVSSESPADSPSRRTTKPAESFNVLTESEPVCDKKSVKAVGQSHVSDQSQETAEDKQRIRMSQSMSATTESLEAEYRMHLKPVPGNYANIQSQYREVRAQLKMSSSMQASRESAPEVRAPKQRNVFGHASEISHEEYGMNAPKMRRVEGRHASVESDFYSYQVKAHRRRKPDQPSVEEETEEAAYRPGIRVDAAHHVSQESQAVDPDEKRLARFKDRNLKGHASDSSVQRLLYGGRFGHKTLDDGAQAEPVTTEFTLLSDTAIEPYQDNFDHLGAAPVVDLTASLHHMLVHTLGDYGASTSPDISAHSFVSLPALIKRSITAPLKTQISLVNQSIVNFFMAELHIEGHLRALRQFLLMRDGEFGQSLSDHLFEKLAMNPLPHEVLNPMFLNNALSKALRLSIHGDSVYAHNLAFALKYLPPVLKQNAPDALDCLELTYKVEWPMNIVITNNSLTKYSRVFSFMLQLKRAVWVLEDVWHKLKRDALINKASAGSQFRQLQLYRHEMQYFVRVMQGYIANQVIHVTWNEFKEDLSNNVHNLDNLHNCHGEYLNKCLSRCLLNQKAAPVMKIIQDIFGLILKFRMQLISHSWERGRDGHVTHPMFSNMCATYNSFNDYSRFLFKVVRKLAIKGYLPHLQELLLRLNFNHYYSVDG